jgi:hypothetical protein
MLELNDDMVYTYRGMLFDTFYGLTPIKFIFQWYRCNDRMYEILFSCEGISTIKEISICNICWISVTYIAYRQIINKLHLLIKDNNQKILYVNSNFSFYSKVSKILLMYHKVPVEIIKNEPIRNSIRKQVSIQIT